MVVCFGSDGHIAIEEIGHSHCGDADTDQHTHEETGAGNTVAINTVAGDAGGCVDVALVTDDWSNHSAKTRWLFSSTHSGDTIALPHWLADTPQFNTLGALPQPQAPSPGTAAHLLAQRTIVLRI